MSDWLVWVAFAALVVFVGFYIVGLIGKPVYQWRMRREFRRRHRR